MSNFELEQPPIGNELDPTIMGYEQQADGTRTTYRRNAFEIIDELTTPTEQAIRAFGMRATGMITGIQNRPERLQEIIETRGITL